MKDEDAWNMYVYGPAGTGKTYSLIEVSEYCMEHGIVFVVVAYTNKACDVLRAKLPKNVVIMTLDKFLKKRPGIDESATKVKAVTVSYQHSQPEPVQLLCLDEYSFINERDAALILELQDLEYTGKPKMKMLALGDDHQLPPVDGDAGIEPKGEYQVKLTKQYRNDNPLQQVLSKLISYIDGEAPAQPLEEIPDYFIRGRNLENEYVKGDVIFCWTNKMVEYYNAKIAGKETPDEGDLLFSPTSHSYYRFDSDCDTPVYIDQFYSDDTLELNSKYMTLEYLRESGLCKYAYVTTEDGVEKLFAYVFGHDSYNKKLKELKLAATLANKAIEKENPGYKASAWARYNNTHPLSRARAKAWRDLLSFKDYVLCLDFTHSMTVHKSQGGTYKRVLIDLEDISNCADFNFNLYLKLVYVAISRAQKLVITN